MILPLIALALTGGALFALVAAGLPWPLAILLGATLALTCWLGWHLARSIP